MDFQHHLKRGRHDIVWGLGYRNGDEKWNAGGAGFNVHDAEQIPSYFVQDTITLVEDRFFVTIGSKFDHNSVTEFEFQPTVRVIWTPDERTSIWGAVSRAVRTPALMERMFTTPDAEEVLAYELGMRRQPNDRLFWEVAGFFNRYDDLLSRWWFFYRNSGTADTFGIECNATYEVNPCWHLMGSYAFFAEDVDYPSSETPAFQVGATPRNQAYLQSGWDLGRCTTLDVMLRYVDSLAMGVDSYFAADVRLAWQPRRNLELSLVGQNLLAGKHLEHLAAGGSNATEIEPGVYGMVAWRR